MRHDRTVRSIVPRGQCIRHFALLLALVILGSVATGQTSIKKLAVEEYSVYSVVLEYFASRPGAHQNCLVIVRRMTASHANLRAILDHIPLPPSPSPPPFIAARDPNDPLKRQVDISRAKLTRQLMEEIGFKAEVTNQTIADWTNKNRRSYRLSSELLTSHRAAILSKSDEQRLQKANGDYSTEFWDGFRSKYPDAIALVRLSRVGLDEEHAQAVVVVDLARVPSPVGSGNVAAKRQWNYVLLEKKDGVWQVRRVIDDRRWIP